MSPTPHARLPSFTSMRPVRVVDRSKVHIVLVAHQRGHHHMRTVQRVHLPLIVDFRPYEVRRERRALTSCQHRQHITTHHPPSYHPLVDLDLHILHRRRDVVHVLATVRLNHRQAQRRDPAHRTIRVGNNRRDFVQPCHNGRGSLIGDADRTECEARQVHTERIQHVVIEVDLLVIAS